MKPTQIFRPCRRAGEILSLILVWIASAFAQTELDFSTQGPPAQGRPPAPPMSTPVGGPPLMAAPPGVPVSRHPSQESMPPMPAPMGAPLAPGELPKLELPEHIAIQPVKYTSEKSPDPFISPFELEAMSRNKTIVKTTEELEISSEELEGFQVTGIVWGSRFPQAIINETVVKIGEAINGASIVDITKEGVYVVYEEKKYLLKTLR